MLASCVFRTSIDKTESTNALTGRTTIEQTIAGQARVAFSPETSFTRLTLKKLAAQ
jgi:hypothetical protein